jgi:hypothetical protein
MVTSKRAIEIIAIFSILPFLTLPEKVHLIKTSKYKKLIIRLLYIIFKGAYRGELVSVTTPRIKNADNRLIGFLELHEQFIIGEISPQKFFRKIQLLLSEALHPKEELFYREILTGSKFSLSYKDVRDNFFDGENFIFLPAKFCKAFICERNWKIDYPVLAQPCLDGYQIKVKVIKGRVRAFDREQIEVTTRFKALTKAALTYATKQGLSKLEIDVIMVAKDMSEQSLMHALKKGKWKRDVLFYIYDAVVPGGEILTRRLQRVKSIIRILTNYGHKYYIAMPTIMVEDEEKLVKLATRYSKTRFSLRKGVIAKDPNSVYEHKRTESWLKIRKSASPSCCVLKQIIWEAEGKKSPVVSLIGVNNNGKEIQVSYPGIHSWIIKHGNNLYGHIFEYIWQEDKPVFRRFMPERGFDI